MINLLRMLNFKLPQFVSGKFESIDVNYSHNNYELFINKRKWNNYNTLTCAEAFQLFAHYYLAEGHCICTGLGFLLRESWLLNNNRVNKITVLENSRDLIEYQNKINSNIMKKIEVIECDADDFVGECNVLLLDHYEQEDDRVFLESIKKINKNIKSDVCWAWSLEPILDCILSSSNLSKSYEKFKFDNDLYFLPKLTDNEILMFMSVFFMPHNFLKKNTLKYSYE